MICNLKRQHSPPQPVGSARDDAKRVGTLRGRYDYWWKVGSTNIIAAAARNIRIPRWRMQALKRGWRSRRRPSACTERWQGTFRASL